MRWEYFPTAVKLYSQGIETPLPLHHFSKILALSKFTPCSAPKFPTDFIKFDNFPPLHFEIVKMEELRHNY